MTVQIQIPNRELDANGGGILHLELSILETINGYTVTDVVSDIYDGNTPENYIVISEMEDGNV